MTKRIIFYFIGFVVLVSLAYYSFSLWRDSREKIDLWTLVPEDAVFVLETNNHAQLVEHLKETQLWDNFSVLPFALRLQENLAWLDSISPGNQRLERFLDKKDILTSVHVVGKSEVQFVFYLPVNSVGEHRFLRTLTENIVRSGTFQEDLREYQGQTLTDVKNTVIGTGFTFFSYHNHIILSSSPTLIEGIVRRINSGNLTSVAADFKSSNYLRQPDVYANVFINYRTLPQLLGLFLREELMPEVRHLASFSQNGMLGLKLEENRLFLNGFSKPEELKDSFHMRLRPQKPRPLEVREYLPNRTAVLLHFGAEQVARLREQPRAAGSIYAGTLDSLANTFTQEVALAYLESYNINASPDKIILAHTGNMAATTALLKKLSEQVNKAKKQTSFTEKYGSYTIEQVKIPDLPAQLFGKIFVGFEQCYVAQVDEYLLIAAEQSTLRGVLDDMAAENVWGKSALQKVLLEETLQEGNFSLFINTVNAWYILNRYMTEESREKLLQQASLIKRFNHITLQFSKAEKQYYTSLLIRKEPTIDVLGEEEFTEDAVISFNSRLTTMPFPVQNAIDRSREVVVQDSAHVLHNILANGNRGWVDSVGSPVQGPVQQLEFGPDNKLRYIFATTNRIHAIDNQGKRLENFPFNLSDSLHIQRLSVFDYEKDGNYRLLVDDNLGNLYMYSIRGEAIEGWQPRRMDYRLAAPPQHLRIGNRDVILVVLENGYIYALNRRGEAYPGFPFSLRVPVASGAFARTGADLRKTEITTVTRYGDVVVFNLQGRVLRREQLLRPSKSAFFELVPDQNGKSFVIVRQDQGRVTLFDQDLNELFEKRYVTSAAKLVQYFHFGGDKKIYAITETGPQKTYLYNANANLIHNTILESSQPVTIYYNDASNSYTLYKVDRRELKQLSFKSGR
ncbi:hypothetical protein [Botryobacter ruber]|uniref:hypothetical protein n=1 Tax=Botryobacter ruber TaxID=2171629 RepID=UPI000E0BC8D8|nr:hypothetical protein [Botryobacter ruber]